MLDIRRKVDEHLKGVHDYKRIYEEADHWMATAEDITDVINWVHDNLIANLLAEAERRATKSGRTPKAEMDELVALRLSSVSDRNTRAKSVLAGTDAKKKVLANTRLAVVAAAKEVLLAYHGEHTQKTRSLYNVDDVWTATPAQIANLSTVEDCDKVYGKFSCSITRYSSRHTSEEVSRAFELRDMVSARKKELKSGISVDEAVKNSILAKVAAGKFEFTEEELAVLKAMAK